MCAWRVWSQVRPLWTISYLLVILPTYYSYVLTSTYDATNFFNNFVFETFADPTHGTVTYVDYPTASAAGLAKYVNNKVHLGVGT